MLTKPTVMPDSPNFSSGPCAKRPGYDPSFLAAAPLGRSHRSTAGLALLRKAIDKTREILGLPEDYLVGIVPASDTGAFEMAMWNLLGPRAVTALHFDAFGKTWADDIEKQLALPGATITGADYGQLPRLDNIDFSNDLVFTWNGTTSGVKIPEGSFIPADRGGLTICDATSAVFAMEIPWDKLDAITFSWQKVPGGEAGHGMLILSPRAVNRLESYRPPWPLPKIFRLKSEGKINRSIFAGSTINTPSLLCVADYLDALDWAENIGGLPELIRRSFANLAVLEEFVAGNDWIRFLAADPKIRSNTSVCLTLDLDPGRIAEMVNLLAFEGAAYDIASYRDAPPGLRFWCGSTVEEGDLAVAMQWLEWAYKTLTGASE